MSSGGSKGGCEGCMTPLGLKIFSFSCSFWDNWQNCLLVPPPAGLAPPTRGNPGFATDQSPVSQSAQFTESVIWSDCSQTVVVVWYLTSCT